MNTNYSILFLSNSVFAHNAVPSHPAPAGASQVENAMFPDNHPCKMSSGVRYSFIPRDDALASAANTQLISPLAFPLRLKKSITLRAGPLLPE
jgi:hypothetical protein